MKAVVVELRGNKAAVLDHDGIVRILPDQDYRIGQVLELSESLLREDASPKIIHFSSALKRHAAAAAASAVIVLGAGGGAAAAWYPVSAVTLEMDNTLEYRLNVFDRVLSVRAQNTEGRQNAQRIEKEVKGRKIEDAVSASLDFLLKENVLTQDHHSIEMRVESFPGRSRHLQEALENRIDSWNTEQAGGPLPEGVEVLWNKDAPSAADEAPGRSANKEVPAGNPESVIYGEDPAGNSKSAISGEDPAGNPESGTYGKIPDGNPEGAIDGENLTGNPKNAVYGKDQAGNPESASRKGQSDFGASQPIASENENQPEAVADHTGNQQSRQEAEASPAKAKSAQSGSGMAEGAGQMTISEEAPDSSPDVPDTSTSDTPSHALNSDFRESPGGLSDTGGGMPGGQPDIGGGMSGGQPDTGGGMPGGQSSGGIQH